MIVFIVIFPNVTGAKTKVYTCADKGVVNGSIKVGFANISKTVEIGACNEFTQYTLSVTRIELERKMERVTKTVSFQPGGLRGRPELTLTSPTDPPENLNCILRDSS